MAELVYEIWHNEETHSFTMIVVSKEADEYRLSEEPNATLLHTFSARSDYEAHQKNNDWHRWGPWKPIEGVPEHLFTEEEAEEQRLYMADRERR